MRLIIAGSRHYKAIHAEHYVRDAMWRWRLEHGMPTEIVSGGQRGIDKAGEVWSRTILGKHATVFPYPGEHGKAGGPIRNAKMAANADALLLIWDGKSKGSADMKKQAERAGLHITEVIVEEG